MSTAAGITYDRCGSGEPLILIHGLGSRRQVWEPVVGAVSKYHDVITVDLPGFGESPTGGDATTVSALTDRLAEFIAALDLNRPHLAGNSMGGGIALELGARGQASSVTVFSPIGFWETPGRIWCQRTLTSTRTFGRSIRPAIPWLIRNRVARTLLTGLVFGRPGRRSAETTLRDVYSLLDSEGFGQACASFTGYRFGTARALREVPVTIAWGHRDVLLTYGTQSRRARWALPEATHVGLPGCGHTPFDDDPAACAELLIHT